MAMPGPVLIEAVIDPLEAPMPPKVDLEQAKNFALSLAKGEPDRAAPLAKISRPAPDWESTGKATAWLTLERGNRSSDEIELSHFPKHEGGICVRENRD